MCILTEANHVCIMLYTAPLHLIEDIHSKMKTVLSESNYQQQDLNTIKDDLGALKFGFAILQHTITELIADSMSQNNMINHIISHILPLQIDQIESTTEEFQAHVQTVSMKLNDINNTVSQPPAPCPPPCPPLCPP